MFNIAIVGATGLVGSTFLKVIEEYDIKVNQLRLFASSKSKGKVIVFNEKEYVVEGITKGCFEGTDYALFSAGGATSLKYAKQAVNEGAIVIDNSSAWRMNPNVPLVVPEVNIEDAFNQSLIANPNCSTIQVVLPLSTLEKTYGIESVSYTTYQAVSGSGINGMKELEQTRLGEGNSFYQYNINETCIPQIDVFLEDGYTKEEQKMIDETKKILHNNNIKINATCVRVPIMNCHAVSVNVVLKENYDLKDIYHLFDKQDGLVVKDDITNLIYPVATEARGTDDVYIGRIRKDKINDNGILFYTVADNIRKGAASNAVQIMIALAKEVR